MNFSQFSWPDPDPRTTNLFFMESPIPVISISLFYAIAAKFVIPWLFRDSEASKYEMIMRGYCSVQLMISTVIFCGTMYFAWIMRYNLLCQPMESTQIADDFAICMWMYLFTKYVDWGETVILTAEKRFEIVNTYHVFHHTMMPLLTWCFVKYYPGGHALYPGLSNSALHVVIYFSFIMRPCTPAWKRFVVLLNILHMTSITAHASILFVRNPCGFPISYSYFVAATSVLFVFMFIFFVWGLYHRPAKETAVTNEG